MIFFVTILGIVLSILIFLNRAVRFGSNFYFALFIFCHSIFAVTSFSFLSEGFRAFIAQAFPYSVIFNMAAGPLMYIYFLSIFRPNFKFKSIYFLHFIPSLLFFINGSPYIFMESLSKSQLIERFITDPLVAFQIPTLLWPYSYHVIFRMLQSFFYLFISFNLFFRAFKSNHFKFKNEHGYHFSYYFFSFLFAFGFYITTLYIGLNHESFSGIVMSDYVGINTIVSSPRIFNALFILSALFHPQLVFEKYFIKNTNNRATSKEKSDFVSSSESFKYDLVEIERLFSAYMESQPCLEPGFSLNSISEGTHLPVHQISYFIKVRYEMSFNDWKNQKRIKHAVSLIELGLAEQVTLESISLQCGYRSRANFVEAFKKVMGMTPSEYLNNHNKS